MSIADSLKSVRFITDEEGQRTGVLLDIETWDALMAWTEDSTDDHLAARALRELAVAGGRPEDWETASEEWPEEENR